jgi:hypothetical protein
VGKVDGHNDEITTMGSEPIKAGWKSPANCRHKPTKNVSAKAKKGQPKDDAPPSVARDRPKRSTTKKCHMASPSANITDEKSVCSSSTKSPQQPQQDSGEESYNSSNNNGVNDDSMLLLMGGYSDRKED